MNIDLIPTGDSPPDVVIEVPVGDEPGKYEFDKNRPVCSSTASTRRCAIGELRLRPGHPVARRESLEAIGRAKEKIAAHA